MTVSLGIDFGTSGARLIAIDTDRNVLWTGNTDQNGPWRETLFGLIRSIPAAIRARVMRIAIDGTSATVLICDRDGIPIAPPLLYNDSRGAAVLDQVKSMAPAGHLTISATSSLTKLCWLAGHPNFHRAQYFLHQADWLAFQLHGKLGISDYHNALKLGYDPQLLKYPVWLDQHPYRSLLPQVLAPGTPVGNVLPQVAHALGLTDGCIVCAGTTDSIAAFIASGAKAPGAAVTSLGSTLVVKLLSHHHIEDLETGVYSHRYGDMWLVGGASNTGGAVLRTFFSDQELVELSQGIKPQLPCDFDYYPLLQPGERFPTNNPSLLPRLTPRPTSSIDFLYGLLTGIAKIEARGYQVLTQMGATPLTVVYTAGGGANNLIWNQIRHQYLQVPVVKSLQQEAAYGTALLAQCLNIMPSV
jgi:D-ribulokinase